MMTVISTRSPVEIYSYIVIAVPAFGTKIERCGVVYCLRTNIKGDTTFFKGIRVCAKKTKKSSTSQ